MKSSLSLLLAITFFSISFPQVENVQIEHAVYTFLHEMKVKGLLAYTKSDDPLLSRFEVRELLNDVEEHHSDLSSTERKLLYKYQLEFSDVIEDSITTVMFDPDKEFFSNLPEMFSDKVKYLFVYQEENANAYFEWLGNFYHGQKFKPLPTNNANLYDIGFRIRGTIFDQLGYSFTVIKGGVSGNKSIAEIIEPRLLHSFKWIEDAEAIGNYDFAYGYLKFHTEPVEDMDIFVQLGREPITFGYGYNSKLVLSGDNPVMDFIKFNFDYGIVHFTSIHASTVGLFSFDRTERYTKYWASNRLKFAIPDLFDIGIGETVVYSGRGVEFGYLSPVTFYKFIEMSLQDRDNGNIYFDLQTKFIDDLELHGTFLLDENILSNPTELDLYTNKTAYQLGAFWYSPLSIPDLSLIAEYTKVRPYVYSHFDIKNTYTAFGKNLGHRIGPNSDEIFLKAAYNVNEWLRVKAEYSHIRRGENILDDEGNVIKNVGGDIYLTHGSLPEKSKAFFLDGERFNDDYASIGLRIEPIRDYIFEISYNYMSETNVDKNIVNDFTYGLIKFTLEY